MQSPSDLIREMREIKRIAELLQIPPANVNANLIGVVK